MALKRRKMQDGVYRSFKIGQLLVSVHRAHLGLLDSRFDLEKIDKDFDISPLSAREKEDYWRTVNIKKRYEKGVKRLSKQIKSFIADYRVSPILGFDGDELKMGYEGRKRGFRVQGLFRFSLWDHDWFQSLDIPKAPKRLTEVFK